MEADQVLVGMWESTPMEAEQVLVAVEEPVPMWKSLFLWMTYKFLLLMRMQGTY